MRSVKQYLPTQQLYVALRSGRNAIKRSIIETLLTSFLGLFLAGTALAQTSLTTLYDFTGVKSDRNPNGDLVMDSQGVLYGVSRNITPGPSKIYQLTPPAIVGGSWTETLLYVGHPQSSPVSGHIQPVIFGQDGSLYGTSDNCMSSSFGCVFQLAPPAVSGSPWTMNVIHLFQGAVTGDGRIPAHGKLAMDAKGNLYGATTTGGLTDMTLSGTVFKLSPPAKSGGAWTESILYKFSAAPGGFSHPAVGVAIDQHGALYGATSFTTTPKGGLGFGVVYQLVPPNLPSGSWTANVISRSLGGTANGKISQLTVASSAKVYGVSQVDFNTHGVFELTPPAVAGGAWTVALLPSNLPHGGNDLSGFNLAIDANGNIYGTDYVDQTAYKLTPPPVSGGTWTYSVLHIFLGGSEGSAPFGRPLISPTGSVFGTTATGGTGSCTGGCGTVFELQ